MRAPVLWSMAVVLMGAESYEPITRFVVTRDAVAAIESAYAPWATMRPIIAIRDTAKDLVRDVILGAQAHVGMPVLDTAEAVAVTWYKPLAWNAWAKVPETQHHRLRADDQVLWRPPWIGIGFRATQDVPDVATDGAEPITWLWNAAAVGSGGLYGDHPVVGSWRCEDAGPSESISGSRPAWVSGLRPLPARVLAPENADVVIHVGPRHVATATALAASLRVAYPELPMAISLAAAVPDDGVWTIWGNRTSGVWTWGMRGSVSMVRAAVAHGWVQPDIGATWVSTVVIPEPRWVEQPVPEHAVISTAWAHRIWDDQWKGYTTSAIWIGQTRWAGMTMGPMGIAPIWAWLQVERRRQLITNASDIPPSQPTTVRQDAGTPPPSPAPQGP